MLAPVTFTYTNNQPIGADTQYFLYANDLAVIAKRDTHFKLEQTFQRMLQELNYTLKIHPNTAETQVCVFQFKNVNATCKLKILWSSHMLQNSKNPKYWA